MKPKAPILHSGRDMGRGGGELKQHTYRPFQAPQVSQIQVPSCVGSVSGCAVQHPPILYHRHRTDICQAFTSCAHGIQFIQRCLMCRAHLTQFFSAKKQNVKSHTVYFFFYIVAQLARLNRDKSLSSSTCLCCSTLCLLVGLQHAASCISVSMDTLV